MKKLIFLIIPVILLGAGCQSSPTELPSRESKIPVDAVKMTPGLDGLPPILHSSEWEDPVPVEGPINTAGGEDSGFYAVDRNEFYVFFTPDVDVPVEEQLLDEVTGIYVSKNINGEWSEPERVLLQKPGKLALDGCEFVQDDTMWICSAREGYVGLHWFISEFKNNKWQPPKEAPEEIEKYEVGELHITADGRTMYFHSARAGGQGEYDIWKMDLVDGVWQEPVNVEIVNSQATEGWPFISSDGEELWFTRTYRGSPAIYRSRLANGEWGEPELILSQFAGESSLDNDGNIYFTHHFYNSDGMIEADIYMAKKK